MSFEVDPNILDARLPSLLLQPLVENAIRHGVSRRAGGGRVRRARVARERLSTARGGRRRTRATRDREAVSGIGLANTRARLERLHGDNYRFELANLPGGGALAAVRLPFSETSQAS